MKQSQKKCVLCPSKAFSRNLCKLCYMKERREGRLDKYKRVLTPVSLETRIEVMGACWFWTGDRNTFGYGVVTTGRGKTRRRAQAHRYVYEKLVGPIPSGMIVMHKCDNPVCVKPAHLKLGTIAENNADTGNKRRHHYGLDHWNGRLSEADVVAIRASDAPQMVLAKKYGVHQSHISKLKNFRYGKR